METEDEKSKRTWEEGNEKNSIRGGAHEEKEKKKPGDLLFIQVDRKGRGQRAESTGR